MEFEVLERHVSPDGMLIFMLAKEGEDWTAGFESSMAPGFVDWHTHGSILAHGTEVSPEQATRSFIDEVLQDKVLIMIGGERGGRIRVIITDSPEDELQDKDQDETLIFRFWSGSRLYRDYEILSSNEVWRGFW